MKGMKYKSGFSFIKGGTTKMVGKGSARPAVPGCSAQKSQ